MYDNLYLPGAGVEPDFEKMLELGLKFDRLRNLGRGGLSRNPLVGETRNVHVIIQFLSSLAIHIIIVGPCISVVVSSALGLPSNSCKRVK